MLSAAEALKITRKNSETMKTLTEIEKEIHSAALQGRSWTFWYVDNLTESELRNVSKELRALGYWVSLGLSTDNQRRIHVGWDPML